MQKHYDYEIMSGNKAVAKWEDNELAVFDQALLPLFLQRVSNADLWLETRAVDSHRAHSRLLKKALRLSEKDDLSTVVRANGATITDNYWIRPIGSGMKHEDVSFSYDYMSKRIASIALNGSYSAFNYVAGRPASNVAELTNVGSFEKCWKMTGGKWWLYKQANRLECFSEVFIYRLCKELGISAAVYEPGAKYVKSLDFTGGAKVNFEPAFSFMGENEDYFAVIDRLDGLCKSAVPDYVKLLFIDTITANPDRHTGNFGLLRNKDTGEILGLAPCFDHNMALISKGYPGSPKAGDLLITLFNEVLEKYPEYKKFIPELARETVLKVIKDVNMKVKSGVIADMIMARYGMIKK